MIAQTRNTEVIIIGAGPSGLMMAAQLLRYGIQPVIIDIKSGPTNQSKALGVHARTLEIYRQMNLADAALQEGIKARDMVFNCGNTFAKFNFSEAGTEQTAYPYVCMLDQGKNERLLLGFLTANTCAVYWQTSLLGFTQSDTGVNAKISRNGIKEEWTCNWLIGADGSHSLVRKQLQIPFKGSAYKQQFYLADLTIANQLDKHTVHVFMNGSLTAAFPLKEKNRFRFIGMLPDKLKHHTDLQVNDIEPLLKRETDLPIQITACGWLSVYKLHHRMAASFNEQRCFLIGDAAHIHSPVGAQGMNTGLQDAYNLAWKLAGVIQGNYNNNILNSYSAERMPVAKKLLKTTDTAFSLLASRNSVLNRIRNWLLPGLISKLWSSKAIKHKLFNTVSQIGINYRNSSLSVHHSQVKHVRAGDRIPYLKFYDEKQHAETDLHAWCMQPGFTLIILGTLKPIDLHTLAKWITLKYPRNLNLYYLPPSTRNKYLFDYFNITEKQKKAIIIRPDMHIGYLNDIVDIDMMDMYFAGTVGWEPAEN